MGRLLRTLLSVLPLVAYTADVQTSVGSPIANAGAAASGMVPASPVVRILHPAEGAVTTAGFKSLIDLAVDNFAFGPDARLCMELPSGQRPCWHELPVQSLVAPAGTFSLTVTLERRTSGSSGQQQEQWTVVARAASAFTVEPHDTCAGKFGVPPCMVLRPQCGKFLRFRFYLYPSDYAPNKHAATLYYALRDSLSRTDDPRDACIFISMNDLHVANVVSEPPETSARRQYRQAWWGNGENHLIFSFGDYAPGFDTQRAILAGSSFGEPIDRAFFRPEDPESLPQLARERRGYDVTIPLPFYRCNMGDDTHLHKFDNATIVESAARPLLLTFKGALYRMPASHPAAARRHLRALHNGRDVLIALTCWAIGPNCDPCNPPACTQPLLHNATTASDPDCAALTAEANQYDYNQLLLQSKFAAVVAGEGTHSYRLYEALQAGSIPVFIGASARPLEGLIDWNEAAIIQEDARPEALLYLEARLRLLPPATLRRMQEKGRFIFQAHFKDMEAQLYSLFTLLSRRFQAVVDVQEAAAALEEQRAALAALQQAQAQVKVPGEEQRRVEEAAGAPGAPAATVKIIEPVAMVEDGAFIPPQQVAADTVAVAAVAAAAREAVMVPGEKKNPDFRAFLPPAHIIMQHMPDIAAQVQVRPLQQPAAATASSLIPSPAATAPVQPQGQGQGQGQGQRSLGQEQQGTQPAATPTPVQLQTRQAETAAAAQSSTAALQARVDAHVHLLTRGNAAIARAARLMGPLQARYLAGIEALVAVVDGRSAGPVQVPVMTGEAAEEIQREIATAVDSWLSFLSLGLPLAADRSLPTVRQTVINTYNLLSQAYGAVGHWRHAATAIQALMLYYTAERSEADQASDTRRVRNSVADIRRTPWLPESVPPPLQVVPYEPEQQLLVSHDGYGAAAAAYVSKIHRAVDTLSELDDAVLTGYGSLAHFTGPLPLTSPHAPFFLLPVHLIERALSLDNSEDDWLHKPNSSALSHVLLPEATAQAVARRLDGSPLLSPRLAVVLAASRQAGLLPPPTAPPLIEPKRIAIVSMCAYNGSQTQLKDISTRNLKRYCDAHGYHCYMATASLDAARPLAWSKVLMLAQFLPHYDWIMWRDCDSFFTNMGVKVEDLILGATTVRHGLAAAAQQQLSLDGVFPALTAFGKSAAAAAAPVTPLHPQPPQQQQAQQQQESLFILSSSADTVEVQPVQRRASAATAAAATAVPPAPAAAPAAADPQVPVAPTLVFSSSAAPPAAASGQPASALSLLCPYVVPLPAASLDAVLSEDGLMLNTGVMLFRNSPWSMSFIRRMYGDHSGPGAADVAAAEGLFFGAELRDAQAVPLAVVALRSHNLSLTAPYTGKSADEIAAEVTAAMRSAPARDANPFLRNRMWEQGLTFYELSQEGVGVWDAQAARYGTGSTAHTYDAATAARMNSTATATGNSGDACGVRAAAYVDASHTQIVHQRWLNSYPDPIARSLHDHKGEPMHAPWQEGDYVVSFSGCSSYKSAEECEALYVQYGAIANK